MVPKASPPPSARLSTPVRRACSAVLEEGRCSCHSALQEAVSAVITVDSGSFGGWNAISLAAVKTIQESKQEAREGRDPATHAS